jgi:replication-associated recombination protein RarA
MLGLPEARIPLSAVVIEMALSPKSNSAEMAIDTALQIISNTNSGNGRNYYDEPMWRDDYSGRSPMSRKMYMEAKHMNKDKATQLRELEKYMQELSQDITEMIADASPEEKQYLEKKISALASKIGQMK